VGRRRPGDPIRFAAVDTATAERVRRDQETEYQALLASMTPVEPAGFDLESLYRVNLISGAVSGYE